MTVHENKTAWRAVDACGGTFPKALNDYDSGWRAGHDAALDAALEAVKPADALTAELLAALQEAEGLLSAWCERISAGGSSWDDWDEFYKTAHYEATKYRPDAGLNERLRAAIAKATGEQPA